MSQAKETSRKPKETDIDFLVGLERQNNYLFHGSPYQNLRSIKPKKAQDLSDDPWSNDKAVYAVDSLIVAIQRAILPKRAKTLGNWYIETDNDRSKKRFILKISYNIIPGKGSVYILPKEKFQYRGSGMQWKSKEECYPLREVRVDSRDYAKLGGVIQIANNKKSRD